jgi:hypothetical protein
MRSLVSSVAFPTLFVSTERIFYAVRADCRKKILYRAALSIVLGIIVVIGSGTCALVLFVFWVKSRDQRKPHAIRLER